MDKIYRGGYVLDSAEGVFSKRDIRVRDGVIIEIEQAVPTGSGGAEIVDVSGKFIVPGLFDAHTHGRVGVDFSSCDDDALSRALADYYRSGTFYVAPTVASAPLEDMYSAVRTIASHEHKRGEAKIVAIHIEGRYLNPEKRGAHLSELLALPSIEELDKFVSLAGDLPIRFSIAPELEGAGEFISRAVELGAKIGLVHSNASFEEAYAAVELGADCFAHTFNCMRPIHHRDPGNTTAALVLDTYAEFIADGYHIAPAVLEIANRCKPKDKFVLVTDSMEAAGMPDGEYSIAGIPVTVKDGKALNRDGAIAGSTVTLLDCVKNYAAFTSASLAEAVLAASANPAKMYSLDGKICSISVGAAAEFLVLDASELE